MVKENSCGEGKRLHLSSRGQSARMNFWPSSTTWLDSALCLCSHKALCVMYQHLPVHSCLELHILICFSKCVKLCLCIFNELMKLMPTGTGQENPQYFSPYVQYGPLMQAWSVPKITARFLHLHIWQARLPNAKALLHNTPHITGIIHIWATNNVGLVTPHHSFEWKKTKYEH